MTVDCNTAILSVAFIFLLSHWCVHDLFTESKVSRNK